MSCFIVYFSICLGVILLANQKYSFIVVLITLRKSSCSIKPVMYEALLDIQI